MARLLSTGQTVGHRTGFHDMEQRCTGFGTARHPCAHADAVARAVQVACAVVRLSTNTVYTPLGLRSWSLRDTDRYTPAQRIGARHCSLGLHYNLRVRDNAHY